MSTQNEKSSAGISISDSNEQVKEKSTKIQIVPNWQRVLKTYSFWVMVASVLLSFIEQVLPYMGLVEPMMTGTAYGITMFVLNVSAILFRMIKQRKLWEYPIKEESKDGVS